MLETVMPQDNFQLWLKNVKNLITNNNRSTCKKEMFNHLLHWK